MSDEASRLIEEAERLAGCRFDDPNNPNALYAIVGALGRAMGKNPHQSRDDIAAGMLLTAPKREGNSALGLLMAMGLGPDEIAALLGTKK